MVLNNNIVGLSFLDRKINKKSLVFCLFYLQLSIILSCKTDKRKYIDYIKINENTYLGVEELLDSLDVPWDIQYNPVTQSIFFTEIKGNISELDLKTNTRKVIYTVPQVYQVRTSGLLAIVVHPDFKNKPYLYTCFTHKNNNSIVSKLLRLHYQSGEIIESKELLEIDGGTAHNGSRMVFGQDGMLYWATGDIYSETHAQDSTTLNGKVLRMTDDGAIPDDNPISDSYVYAWGFRNIQGITLTSMGNIIASEHGDAIEDELNWVRPLHNYGWKQIEGYHDLPKEKEYATQYRTTEPIKAWTPVIAPAAVHYPLFNTISEWKNSLLLGTLKDQSLHVIRLNETHSKVLGDDVYLKDVYGRIRAITSDHKGNIYLATSNRDWKRQEGFPKQSDDRILKLSKVNFIPDFYTEKEKRNEEKQTEGNSLYQSYCASCHMADGQGIRGTFPPLTNPSRIGNKESLIQVILNGMHEEIVIDGVQYKDLMPAFHFLTDHEIAKIVNYIRANFGNNFAPIESSAVASQRIK